MRVLIKEPGKPWETAEVENTLDALQKAVGGCIETLPIVATDTSEEAVMVMDEEGQHYYLRHRHRWNDSNLRTGRR